LIPATGAITSGPEAYRQAIVDAYARIAQAFVDGLGKDWTPDEVRRRALRDLKRKT
jgi:hypothetical protein